MQPIIKIENLSKIYRLGVIGTGTISHDLNRWWYKIRGKEDPYLKIGEANISDHKSGSGYVWALKDINLEVKPGEVLGIIGKNGAGKSTLLKILSKVTGPTTGNISYRGRIGSLLEVGTGFHPELTGRENIFLNGAILGMTKAEIRSKLDEIVAFAGVERYIDTPVKRYSSGMMVRLGFAVAAHLEPEILVVDEVLAVGDAEFQKKAVGKMQDISNNDGRTILFVSHNMAAVKRLCNKAMILQEGQKIFTGETDDAVNFYLSESQLALETEKKWNDADAPGNKSIKVVAVKVYPERGEVLNTQSGFLIEVVFYNENPGINLDITLELLNKENVVIFHKGIQLSHQKDSKIGYYRSIAKVPGKILNANIYKLNLIFGENLTHLLFSVKEIINFQLHNYLQDSEYTRLYPGVIKPELSWETEFLEKI